MIKEREDRESKLFESLLQDARRGLEERTALDPNSSEATEPREEEAIAHDEEWVHDSEGPRDD